MPETVIVQVQPPEGVVMAIRVTVIKRLGAFALHHPYDDIQKEYYTLTHVPSGRCVLSDEFVIDARLPIPMLMPVLTEIAALFPADALTSLTPLTKAVVDALTRVIENMEKAILSDV